MPEVPEAADASIDGFIAGLGPRGRDLARDTVRAALNGVAATVAADLPALGAPGPSFYDHLGRHLAPAEVEPLTALAEARVSDLYLAASCLEGNEQALTTFRTRYAADITRSLAQVRIASMDADDVMQELLRRLVSGPNPKLASYSGRGDLRTWVRLVTTRALLDIARVKRNAERPTDDSAFDAVAAPNASPELAHFRNRYQREIALATERAARSLSPEERNALREHYALGLTVDQIAAAHGIHRATAARRVQRAREELVHRIKRVLDEDFGLKDRDLASVLELVRSQMHITMERVLAVSGP